MKRIAVLLTCHNRCGKTITCLEALCQNLLPDRYSLEVFLVDDGSTDGTAETTLRMFRDVHVINGSGTLYWNGGMRVAFTAAMEKGFDYYFWLNDDTLLYPQALNSLLATCHDLQTNQGKFPIVVGSTQDALDGRPTYGGVTRPSKWKTTAFQLIAPSNIPVECETMNGNCVLIPKEIAQTVGNLEPGFMHAMGDLDYGLRARNAGFSVWMMPGYAGTCSHNAVTGSFNDVSLSVFARLRKMIQPKGLPLSSWRIFTQRHAGPLWPAFWLWPYAKVLLKGLVNK